MSENKKEEIVEEKPRNFTAPCWDCGKIITTKDDDVIGGKFLVYEIEGAHGKEKIGTIKCDECFEKNPALTDYKSCEVYSRIVGYMRPVQQWNVGKVQEFKDRKEFKDKK